MCEPSKILKYEMGNGIPCITNETSIDSFTYDRIESNSGTINYETEENQSNSGDYDDNTLNEYVDEMSNGTTADNDMFISKQLAINRLGGIDNVESIVECKNCNLSFHGEKSRILEKHRQQCAATAIIKNPIITSDDTPPKYMELDFDKIHLPYSTKRKNGYGCRICKRSMISSDENMLTCHR